MHTDGLRMEARFWRKGFFVPPGRVGADSAVVVHVVAVRIDVAAGIHDRGVIRVVALRPQPSQPHPHSYILFHFASARIHADNILPTSQRKPAARTCCFGRMQPISRESVSR